jgi:hypothetical protein
MKRDILIIITFFIFNSICYSQENDNSLDSITTKLDLLVKDLSKNQTALADSIQNIKIELNDLKSDKEKELEYFSNTWIPILTFLIALITILFGWSAINHNKKIRLYELVLDITKEYASEEMLNGILLIRKWEQENKEVEKNFAEEFGKIRKSDYQKIKALDIARRKIAHYFGRIYLLKKNGVIKNKEIMKIISTGQIEILIDLIEPLEESIDSNYNKSIFNFFANLRNELEKKT